MPGADGPTRGATHGRGAVVFKKILCAIDHSPSSLKALQYALDLGRQAAGCVTVLYALEYTDPDEILEPSPFDPVIRPLRMAGVAGKSSSTTPASGCTR